MDDVWARIEIWLSAHAPEILEILNKGTTTEDLEKLEHTLGYVLPDDLKTSLKIHNGQDQDAEGFLDSWELLSVERMLGRWTFLKEFYDAGEFAENSVSIKGNLANEWWSPAWLPITDNGNGDYHYLDLTPGSTYGHILTFWHDWEERKAESESFKDWLSQFATQLEAGLFEITARGSLERKS
jgi:cell wall assembly regulator SMI1